MRIKLLPEDERPVEKALSSGIESLSNAELIALVLHTGFGGVSAIHLGEEILAGVDGGIKGLGKASPDELMSIKGVGRSKACALAGAVELGKRIASAQARYEGNAESAESVADMFMEELRYKQKEHFKCLLVDAKGKVIFCDDVSVGDLSTAVVHPREVFSQAVKRSASAVILVHNHPSGDPSPSSEDIKTTARLSESGRVLGIKVLDHVIIGDGRYISMRGAGLME